MTFSDEALKDMIVRHFSVSPAPFYSLCLRTAEEHSILHDDNGRTYTRMLEIKKHMMNTTKEFFINQNTDSWAYVCKSQFPGNLIGHLKEASTPTLAKKDR